MTTTASRRRFLRHAGLLSGGAMLVRFAPANFFEAPAQARAIQAAAAQPDSAAAIRAQMGLLPIETTRLGDRLVMLSGPGGNVVVLHGPDGKVVVDSFVQPAWPRLKAAIDALDGPSVKTLIDTHWHLDHTDNNANFRAAGAAVVAHVNTKKRMGESHELLGMHFNPSPAAALPTATFTQKHALRANGEQIAITYVPPAHTDTDIFVHYAKGNVLHMGDTFFNGMYPFIDAGTGGNINGMIGAAERGLALTNATTKIVPGHGPLADRAVLEAYRAMLTTVRDRVRTQKGAGRTLAEVQAAKPSAEFDAVWGKGMMPPDNFVAFVYGTL